MKKSKIATYLKRKKENLIPCVYHFYKKPMLLVKGRGIYLYDDTGRKYLDAYSGVGVVNCGHCHPRIVRAALKQLKTLQHTTTIYVTAPLLDLARKLSQYIGHGLTRSFFCTSGSEANEGAMRLAKLYTGRTHFIAHKEALHGRTYLTTGATGLDFWRTDPDPPANIHFIPSPICSQCPHRMLRSKCNLRCADDVLQVLKQNPNQIAGMIAEVVHGNGGIYPAPQGYFAKIKKYLARHKALLILDEAQTGFGRTGRRFGFEHHETPPDILTVCKALGNGLPISAFVTTDKIASCYTRPGASTFGGNQVSAAAAMEALDVHQKNRLAQNADRIGDILKQKLYVLKSESAWVKDVRGLGLMLGVEMIHPETGEPASAKLDEILEMLKDEGILAGKTGKNRNVLTFMPPLIVRKKDVDQIASTLKRVFKKLNLLKENIYA